MGDRGKAQVVDGRMLILSMRQAAKDGEGKPPLGGVHGERKVEMPSEEAGAGPKTVGGGLSGGGLGHIGKTTQPTKRTIRCFECGYECQMTGTTKAVYCSKCRAKIEMGDARVEGEWTRDVQTGGDVRVAAGARVLGAKIRAGNVVLEGELDGYASVECGQWLELATPTPPRARQVSTRDLRVAAGCEWVPGGKLQVRHLEVWGTLEADVEASGAVHVMAGGHLKGSLKASHLQVEEGGGVSARLFVWPGGGGAE
ncbi:MAG: polymer-forming cytoskeletal protein [Kiritimatiellae bacterium]|nr:polymer-forming cytoskeletal protein [Kiritimatiellia bacterium]